MVLPTLSQTRASSQRRTQVAHWPALSSRRLRPWWRMRCSQRPSRWAGKVHVARYSRHADASALQHPRRLERHSIPDSVTDVTVENPIAAPQAAMSALDTIQANGDCYYDGSYVYAVHAMDVNKVPSTTGVAGMMLVIVAPRSQVSGGSEGLYGGGRIRTRTSHMQYEVSAGGLHFQRRDDPVAASSGTASNSSSRN